MFMHSLKKGQAVIEYALLVAIAIIALVGTVNFVSKIKKNAFEDHFQRASYLIGGINP
jgi:uncharacterized protein (UPF0333 family)